MIGEFIKLCGPATFTGLDDLDCVITPPLSQVCLVIIAPHGCRTPQNWTDGAQWLSLIDNTDTTGEFMHVVTGRGSLTSEDITVSLRTYTSLCRRVFTLTHTVEAGANNYALARTLERNYTGFRIWFVTIEGYLYGGTQGLQVRKTGANLLKSEESEAVENFPLVFEWYADGDAGRVYVPTLIGKEDEEEPPNEIEMYRQQFLTSNTNALTWTQNSGNVPSDTTVRAWVFMNGQKLLPLQYSVTPLSGPGQSTFTISTDTHFDGANYEIYTFP